MKVYYAHAMPLYGSIEEGREKKQIMRSFHDVEIIDPGTFQNNPQKKREGMEYCFKLIRGCHTLIFSRFKGKITSGVGKEANYALEEKIDVFELNRGKLREITKPVKYLSILETISLPGYYPKR